VQGNATDSWGSPSLEASIVAPAKRRNGFTVKLGIDMTGETGYAAYRYTRISIGDDGSSPAIANSVPVGLKVWLGGAIRTLGRDFDFSPIEPRHQMQTAAHTDTGYGWFYKLSGFIRGLQGSLFLETAEAQELQDWYDEAGSDPVILIPDPDEDEAWIVRWASSPTPFGEEGLTLLPLPTVIYPDFAVGWRRFQVSFVEVTAGGPEWL